jgi:predicted DCC family thiol-disulfide oxidoreductase YuxK
MVVLFDGHCRFCTRGAKTIARRFGADRVTTRDFQEAGVLDDYPGVTHEACMKKIHLVMPDGRVYAGAEAFARLFATVRIVGWIAFVYYVPGLRQIAELVYTLVARARYRLFGRREACNGGTCHMHGA